MEPSGLLRRPNGMRSLLCSRGKLPPVVLLLLPLIVIAGCGDAVAPTTGGDEPPAPGGGSPGSPGTTYKGTGAVLESTDHGPQLCLGGVAESYPPQCGGPDIVGWDWDAVEAAESASGTTWGSYTVIGTYDGQRFTLTEPARAPEEPSTPPDEDMFATPCEPPSGGWAVVDESTATDTALNDALALAAQEDDYVGAWVDQSINPASGSSDSEELELAMNDPTKLVLNVMFTGDLDRHEADLREIWGGALCVSAAERTEADLLSILDEVMTVDGVLGGSPDPRTGTVQVQVIVDDGFQQQMDEEYGPGVVTVHAALQPVG